MEIPLEAAVKFLAAQPFSRHLNARLTAFGGRSATLEVELTGNHLQQHGYVHGGVLSYAADNAITFAAGTMLGPNILTSGLSIEYLAPAQGVLIRATASVVHSSSRRVTCRCDVHAIDGDGTGLLCAVAQGTVVARSTATVNGLHHDGS
ncbi:PaaI family thioesterase [Micromonospora sp. NPDC005324]|uniref:PaaI family thioesterase n=1 Tax=Micromonospora sp. NPDC005324 TaxID=3157033 RepID=UPI0033BAAEB9